MRLFSQVFLWMQIIGSILTVCSEMAWAANKTSKAASSTQCSARQREIKDCHLKIAQFPVQLWQDKIILRGPVDRSMVEIPIKDASDWELARGHHLAQRAFLEFIIWAPAAGEAEVESANLYIYEIQRGKIQVLLEKIVQKRKKIGDGQYEKDKRQIFSIKAKNKKVHWALGKESGTL